ncbi:guanylate kinase [Candidatus Woesearchaeota archaeon]|nr:guanylate kinase [Candidatus Woesearchaeota archaeon]
MDYQPPNFVPYNIQEMLKIRTLENVRLSEPLAQSLNHGRQDSYGKRLIYISGPNGVGKDTLLDIALDILAEKGIESISRFPRTTTRPRRKAERDGIDYFFQSEEEMLDGWRRYIAMTRYPANQCLYGIDGAKMGDALQGGRHVVMVAGIDFAPVLKKFFPESTSIYILPPSAEELERRLSERESDSEELRERFRVGEEEIISVFGSLYGRRCYFNNAIDAAINNDDLQKSSLQLAEMIEKAMDGVRPDPSDRLERLRAEFHRVMDAR